MLVVVVAGEVLLALAAAGAAADGVLLEAVVVFWRRRGGRDGPAAGRAGAVVLVLGEAVLFPLGRVLDLVLGPLQKYAHNADDVIGCW